MNDNISKSQFRYVSNMKDKPNSQGALLHKVYGEPGRYGMRGTPTEWRYAEENY